MSGSNGEGVFRIERKGTMKVAFGDELPFEFDVIKAYNDWFDLRRQFEDEKGAVVPEMRGQVRLAMHNFVCELAGINPNESTLTAWDVEAFMQKAVIEKAEELLDFFAPKSKDAQSSPESTELRFST